MTITMVIVIIAAVIFSVFCFLCVYFLFHNRVDTKKNEKRMQALEQKMGLMGELINNKTDMLAEKMSEQGQLLEAVRLAEEEKAKEKEPEPDSEDEISLEDIFGIDFSDEDFEDVIAEEPEKVPEPVSQWAAPIEEIKQEIPVETVVEAVPVPVEAVALPVEPVVPLNTEPLPTEQVIQAEPAVQETPVNPLEQIMQAMATGNVAQTVPAEPIITPQESIIEERFEVGKSGRKYTVSELEKLIRE